MATRALQGILGSNGSMLGIDEISCLKPSQITDNQAKLPLPNVSLNIKNLVRSFSADDGDLLLVLKERRTNVRY